MNSTKTQKTNKNLDYFLNLVSVIQISTITLLGLISLCKNKAYFYGFIISGVTFFLYMQLMKYSSHSKSLSLLGFPVRLLLVTPICAILVHKLKANLIALFSGLALSIIIYLILMSLNINQLTQSKK